MKEVAVGILARDGTVLACQRRRGAVYPLKWEFPGGKLEPGETAAAALKRELKEELDVVVERAEPFHVQEWEYPASKGISSSDGHFRVHYFLVTRFAGEPVNLAFESILWVTPDALAALDVLEGNAAAINRLRLRG